MMSRAAVAASIQSALRDPAPESLRRLCLTTIYPAPAGPLKIRVVRPAPADVDDAAFHRSLEQSGLLDLHEACWPTSIAQAQ